MNQVMHKMRNARLALQLGKNIEDDQTQPTGTDSKVKKEAAIAAPTVKGFNQLATKRRTVFFAGMDEKEISTFFSRAQGTDNEMKQD